MPLMQCNYALITHTCLFMYLVVLGGVHILESAGPQPRKSKMKGEGVVQTGDEIYPMSYDVDWQCIENMHLLCSVSANKQCHNMILRNK